MIHEALALDTSVVVKHLRGQSPEISLALEQAGELYLPTTALGELLFGVERSGHGPRAKQPLDKFLDHVILIAPDDQTAGHYAKFRAFLEFKGIRIPENDLWIAATAHRHQLRLFHADAHFEWLQTHLRLFQV